MDYGDLIKRGWHITWNNKFLWILGFLAALGGNGRGGGGGGGGTNFQFPSGTSGPGPAPFEDLDPSELEELFGLSMDMLAGIAGAIFFVICCLAIFFLVMWFIRFIAEAGMIQAVVDVEDGLKSNFNKAFADGRQYLWTLFGVRILLILPILLLVLLTGGIVASIVGFGATGGESEAVYGTLAILAVCVFCLIFPYSLLITFIYPMAQRGVVLRELGIMDGIRHGWQVFKGNPVELFLLAVIFFFIGIGFGIVTAIAVLPILAVTAGPAIFSLISNSTVGTGLIVLGSAGLIAAIVVGAIINSVLISFRSATFTLAYRQLTGKAKLAKATP